MRIRWAASFGRVVGVAGVLRVVGVLAVGVSVGVAGCAAGRAAPDRRPTASPSATVIPATSMLTPGDLAGAGWRVRGSGGALSPSPAAWPWALRQCILYDAAEYPAQQHRIAVRAQSYGQGAGREVTEQVEWYAAGWGARSLEDTRRVLDTCGRYEYTDATSDFLESHAVVAEAFAGDEALLVETTRIAPPGPAPVRYTAVVRTGDLVVTVAGAGVPQAEVRRLATVALARVA
jgi:hypothetical protein